jgi:hypothetical protein
MTSNIPTAANSSYLKLQVPVQRTAPRGTAAASALIYGLFRAVQSVAAAATHAVEASLQSR